MSKKKSKQNQEQQNSRGKKMKCSFDRYYNSNLYNIKEVLFFKLI